MRRGRDSCWHPPVPYCPISAWLTATLLGRISSRLVSRSATAQVTELADAAWIFVDAGSGEPYGVRFTASPPCFGLSAGQVQT